MQLSQPEIGERSAWLAVDVAAQFERAASAAETTIRDDYNIEKTDGCRERVRRVDVVAQQRDAEKKRRGRSIGREGNDGRLRSERKFALVDARSAIGRVVSRSESAVEPGG